MGSPLTLGGLPEQLYHKEMTSPALHLFIVAFPGPALRSIRYLRPTPSIPPSR
jgi:hypothetical protein